MSGTSMAFCPKARYHGNQEFSLFMEKHLWGKPLKGAFPTINTGFYFFAPCHYGRGLGFFFFASCHYGRGLGFLFSCHYGRALGSFSSCHYGRGWGSFLSQNPLPSLGRESSFLSLSNKSCFKTKLCPHENSSFLRDKNLRLLPYSESKFLQQN